jgi:ABC-2 type transport system ATP-binding protein
MTEVVKTINLNKRFAKTQALSDLSVAVSENSITGLIGRNGSGKTTLMKILAGFLDKTSGDALVFGEQPMDNLPVLKKLIYTYHNMTYDPRLSLSTILAAYKTMFPEFDLEFAGKLIKYFELDTNVSF